MKKIQIIISIILVFTPIQIVFAQNASTEMPEIETVAQRCELSQRYLKDTLKPRDLRTRVNRLQAYQYIYQRLDILVVRLEHNHQVGSVELRTQMNEFSKSIDQFKSQYETYDLSREVVSKYKNCRQNPDEFLKKVDLMRQSRQKLNSDIKEIQDILAVKFKLSLEQLGDSFTVTPATEMPNE